MFDINTTNMQMNSIRKAYKETANINTSLYVLSLCVSSIVDFQKHPNANKHIPYRNSALTRLLQSHLSGEGKTTILATIHEDHNYIHETYSTLQFASRASKIKTKVNTKLSSVMKTTDSSSSNSVKLIEAQKCIQQLQLKIQSYEKMLKVQEDALNSKSSISTHSSVNNNLFCEECELCTELRILLQTLQTRYDELEEQYDKLRMKYNDVKDQNELLRASLHPLPLISNRSISYSPREIHSRSSNNSHDTSILVRHSSTKIPESEFSDKNDKNELFNDGENFGKKDPLPFIVNDLVDRNNEVYNDLYEEEQFNEEISIVNSDSPEPIISGLSSQKNCSINEMNVVEEDDVKEAESIDRNTFLSDFNGQQELIDNPQVEFNTKPIEYVKNRDAEVSHDIITNLDQQKNNSDKSLDFKSNHQSVLLPSVSTIANKSSQSISHSPLLQSSNLTYSMQSSESSEQHPLSQSNGSFNPTSDSNTNFLEIYSPYMNVISQNTKSKIIYEEDLVFMKQMHEKSTKSDILVIKDKNRSKSPAKIYSKVKSK
jgi:hypothetical protein